MIRSLNTDEALAAAFKLVDRKDPIAIRKWFDDHPELTTNDHAQIANLSARTIRGLKKLAGLINKDGPKCPRVPIIPPVIAIDIPADWRTNREWLQNVIQTYSENQLSKAIGCDRKAIRTALKRNGVKNKSYAESTRSKNKCCTHEWCYRHYIILGYSQTQCSKLASIAVQTFADWLNRFKIPVRGRKNSSLGRKELPMWESILAYNLRQQPIVRKVFVRQKHIHVRYRNYFWETYYSDEYTKYTRPYTYFKLDAQSSNITKIPLVYPEYGTDIDGKILHPANIAISRQDLKDSTLIEKRLAVHEFTRQIITRGWINPTFPYEVLQDDFDKCKDFNIAKYMENGGFTSLPRLGGEQIPIGRKLMMHFFDFSRFWPYLKSPRRTIKILNQLVPSRVKFNFFNLLLTTASNSVAMPIPIEKRLNIPDPIVYAAIFKRLNLHGTIFDISVGLGNRAIACAMTNLRYTTNDNDFDFAIKQGFLDFTGLEYEPYTNGQIDIALYDEGFNKPDMSKVLPYFGKAKTILVFAPYTCKEELLSYKPLEAIRIRTRFFDKTPNYIFRW